MTRKRLIIHPIVLADPREAATYHLRTAIVEGGATLTETYFFIENVWGDGGIAAALCNIWKDRRRFSRDNARIAQEMPHAEAA